MIKKVSLRSFRNHSKLDLDFDNKFVYINGPNGSGKTSILEAIHYISTTKSHRTNNDIDVIKNEQPFAVIKIDTEKKKYSMVISDKGKIPSINSKEIRKLSDVIGDLKVIMFAPEDLNIIKGSPSIRRGLIDLELMKIDKEYLSNLSVYKNILKQRNAHLKNLGLNDDLTILNILGKQLYEVGIKLMSKRNEFINKLNIETKNVYQRFSEYKIDVIYEPNLDNEMFLNHIENNQKQDILYKTTVNGPHRDDFVIMFNDKNAKNSSQGETRLMVVALKLGLLKVIKSEVNDEVILLLDDVLSELDNNVQNKFLNELPEDVQVIMNSAIKIKSDKIQIINLKENDNERP